MQKVLSVIAKALGTKFEVSIITYDDPLTSDESMYGIAESPINVIYLKRTTNNIIEYLPSKSYSYLYKKKIIPQNKLTAKFYGVSSFPPSKRNALINNLNEQNFDIIIGVHAFLSLNLASIRHKLNARKVIGWMHNSYDAFFNTPGVFLWAQKSQFKYEMRKLDEIIVLSHNDKELYNSSLGLNPITIYNPLTIDAIPDYKCGNKFLAIGRMSSKAKGFDILVKAFAIFAQHNKEWSLDIVGEGSEKSLLNQIIAENHLGERVKIYPFTKDIGKYYKTSSVYVLSSRWEGFGLVLTEAMAFGLPIIASNIPIVKELFVNRNNLLVFESENILDLANTLEKAAQLSHEELETMSEESIQMSSDLGIKSIIKNWESLLISDK